MLGVQNMLGGGARMKLGGAHPPRKSASGKTRIVGQKI